jgi:hypothetical protein
MKILTKQEEQEHYNATVKGGLTGGTIGLVLVSLQSPNPILKPRQILYSVLPPPSSSLFKHLTPPQGGGAVYLASARFATIRHLTLPMKTFLTTSTATFAAIIAADRASRSYEWNRDPTRQYVDASTLALQSARSSESVFARAKDWGRENRYPIVTASWVASMGIALVLVGRNPYLSGTQKLVQARVYAQGLTLAVLVATAAFEVGDANKGRGRWETVKVLDPDDPDHKHMIEKRIHHESYSGEDLWRGVFLFYPHLSKSVN